MAYTLEQCWHRVPGGTASATIRLGQQLAQRNELTLLGVAGRHRRMPLPPWTPPVPTSHLPLASPWLYETWLRFGWPKVEMATGPVDVCHATTLIPCPSDAPLVVTIHDLAFLHDPSQFSKHGVRVFHDSLDAVRRRAELVLCCSQTTLDDCEQAGIARSRLRLVPWGVDTDQADAATIARVRSAYRLPEQFVLFVGTLEPRKNLVRLAQAMGRLDHPMPLVICGPPGWGTQPHEQLGSLGADVRFLGFVPEQDLAGLYAAATVFAYPSEREGFGLPILEAMAQATAVVTSASTATEETAGGAAVLVDPFDVDSIADGISEAVDRRDALGELGRARAAAMSWDTCADLTVRAYRELTGSL